MDNATGGPRRGTLLFFSAVGVAMFLGFGLLGVTAAREFRDLSRSPTELPVAAAAAPGPAEARALVRLTDLVVPCDADEQRPDETAQRYRLGTDPARRAWLLIESRHPFPCASQPRAQTGTLRVMRKGEVVDLAFPERPWDGWDGDRVVLLDPDANARDAGFGVALSAVSAIFGLFIARFYFVGWRRRAPAGPGDAPLLDAPLSDDEIAEREHRAGGIAERGGGLPERGEGLPERVLPDRRLDFAAGQGARTGAVVGFFAVCGALFAVLLAWFAPEQLTQASVGVWIIRGLLFLLFGGLVVGCWLICVLVAVANARSGRICDRDRVERWLPLHQIDVVEAEGFDVGNRSYSFAHPGGGAGSLIVGVDEAPPWVVDGHVLAVYPQEAPRRLVLLRVDGAPFALHPDEMRAARRAALL